MKNRWVILVASLCGAVIGVVIVRYGVHLTSSLPAFALDRAALEHGRYLVAAIPWILFSLYWEIAAKGAAEAKSSESRVVARISCFSGECCRATGDCSDPRVGAILAGIVSQHGSGNRRGTAGIISRDMGASSTRPQLERGNFDQVGARVDPVRTVPMAEASYLHGIAGNVCGRRAHYW